MIDILNLSCPKFKLFSDFEKDPGLQKSVPSGNEWSASKWVVFPTRNAQRQQLLAGFILCRKSNEHFEMFPQPLLRTKYFHLFVASILLAKQIIWNRSPRERIVAYWWRVACRSSLFERFFGYLDASCRGGSFFKEERVNTIPHFKKEYSYSSSVLVVAGLHGSKVYQGFWK